ncbi:MAG TPA: TIGR03435 family protein, partial [Bryobacteraceae bacterium]|nr:TIGR03435 family protein [Bryobacteraceae bacterium]
EPGKPLPRLCGMSRVTNDGFDAPGVTMRDFCRLLSDSLDRTVVDRTGIAGVFDIHLDLSAADLGHPGPSHPASPASPPDAGDILLAVRKSIQKIGLKLESVKGPGEFLVVDHVERPSRN